MPAFFAAMACAYVCGLCGYLMIFAKLPYSFPFGVLFFSFGRFAFLNARRASRIFRGQ